MSPNDLPEDKRRQLDKFLERAYALHAAGVFMFANRKELDEWVQTGLAGIDENCWKISPKFVDTLGDALVDSGQDCCLRCRCHRDGQCRALPPVAGANSLGEWPRVKQSAWCARFERVPRPSIHVGALGVSKAEQ